MRGLVPQVIWVLLLPILLSGLSSPSLQATSPSSVVILEVCPDFRAEFVVLENAQPNNIDLRGWSLSDGEGSVVFSGSLILSPGERVVVTSNRSITAVIYPNLRNLEYPSEVALQGRFILANDGDDLWLKNQSGAAVDGLVYGSGSPQSIWSGPPLKRIPSGEVAQRREIVPNSVSAADWAVVPPGRSSFQPETFEAVVEPFSCPENALPRLLREIELATRSIQVSVYELSSAQIVEALSEKGESGIDVEILIEGQPVSGISNASIAAAQILADKGCDVRVLKTSDGYRRYDFLHCKYLLVDGHRTVVVSENMGKGLWGNRGWGVVAESRTLGAYFQRIFVEDFRNTSFDITGISHLEDHRQDYLPNGSLPALGQIWPYRANVSPVISPDNSFIQISRMISSAQSRICVEQLEFDEHWLREGGLMEAVMAAARRGVQVRILLDSTFSPEIQEVVSSLNSLARDQCLDLEARCSSPYQNFEIMHNKGVIVDDSCLVSSINWVDGALYNNREVGLIVDSKEISSFFYDLFSQDWSVDPDPPEIRIADYIEAREGNPIFLNASACFDRSAILSYQWDLGGDGSVDWTGERCLVSLPHGNHTILLRVTDAFNNSATAILIVEVIPTNMEGAGGDPILFAILLAGAIFIFSSIWKSIKVKK